MPGVAVERSSNYVDSGRREKKKSTQWHPALVYFDGVVDGVADGVVDGVVDGGVDGGVD